MKIFLSVLFGWRFTPVLFHKHPEIKTSNECGWLFRSYQVSTETNYDIINAANDLWIAWTGEVVWDSQVSIECTTCSDDSDCSYQGSCKLRDDSSYWYSSFISFSLANVTGNNGVCSCNHGRRGEYDSWYVWFCNDLIPFVSNHCIRRLLWVRETLRAISNRESRQSW